MKINFKRKRKDVVGPRQIYRRIVEAVENDQSLAENFLESKNETLTSHSLNSNFTLPLNYDTHVYISSQNNANTDFNFTLKMIIHK